MDTFITLNQQVDDADEDGSGSINFQEFVSLMLKRQEGGLTKEEIKEVSEKLEVETHN